MPSYYVFIGLYFCLIIGLVLFGSFCNKCFIWDKEGLKLIAKSVSVPIVLLLIHAVAWGLLK